MRGCLFALIVSAAACVAGAAHVSRWRRADLLASSEIRRMKGLS